MHSVIPWLDHGMTQRVLLQCLRRNDIEATQASLHGHQTIPLENNKIMITKEEVQKIAKLARLKFEEDKVEEFSSKLSTIMDMIDILNEIDCKDIEPLTSVSNRNARMRLDEVTSSDLSSELFDNVQGQQAELAKEVKYFITPKVVE